MKFISKLNLTTKIYIVGGVVAITLLGLLVFVIFPLQSDVATLSAESYDKRITLAIYEQQRANIEITRKDYRTIQNDLENISKVFVVPDNELDLISQLEDIAIDNDITQSIDIDSSSGLEINGALLISILASGTWNSIVHYFSDIEQMDYYVTIGNITIIDEATRVSATFTANAFYQ